MKDASKTEPKTDAAVREITLPSGAKATIRAGVGRDVYNAQRKAKEPADIMYHLISDLAQIDGKRVVFEDVMEMPLDDVMELLGAFGNFPSRAPKP